MIHNRQGNNLSLLVVKCGGIGSRRKAPVAGELGGLPGIQLDLLPE